MDTYNLFLIDIENVGYSGIEELSEVLEYVDADLYVAYYYMGVSKTAINYLNEIGAVIDEISGIKKSKQIADINLVQYAIEFVKKCYQNCCFANIVVFSKDSDFRRLDSVLFGIFKKPCFSVSIYPNTSEYLTEIELRGKIRKRVYTEIKTTDITEHNILDDVGKKEFEQKLLQSEILPFEKTENQNYTNDAGWWLNFFDILIFPKDIGKTVIVKDENGKREVII